MKKLKWYDKFVFFLNWLFAGALLFSYFLPFIPPKTFALLSVLSLGVPLLIMANVVFLIYWLIKLKKQLILSLIALILGFNHVTSIYKLSANDEALKDPENFTILSYNVKQFNRYGWDKTKNIPLKISSFIKEHDPEIIGMQEYYKGELTVAESFPHKYIKLKEESSEFGLAILSKFPIVNSGSLDFPTQSNNNGIFADIVVQGDTLRVINIHLQSYSLKPDIDNLQEEQSKKVFLGMGKTFVKQQDQIEIVMQVMRDSPYKVILMGDFNNTAYSYIYREIISLGMNDAYKEEGNGFGRSFDFDYFPLRIDFIFVDEAIEIVSFETMEVFYSDHFPIKATLKL